MVWVLKDKKKNMWVYEGCFDIINRNEIQVKFMDSYLGLPRLHV